MGLDFYIYMKKKGEDIEEINERNQLCYGRKAWDLVHFLKLPIDADEEYPVVKPDDWNRLMKSVGRLVDEHGASCFNDVRKAYLAEEKCAERDWELPDEYKRLILDFEVWYDLTFNEGPAPDYEFALGYIEDFYLANERVQRCYEDPELEVRAIISY